MTKDNEKLQEGSSHFKRHPISNQAYSLTIQEGILGITIKKRAAQTLLSWCFWKRYISPRAVITLVTFFRTVTIATLIYFKLQITMPLIKQWLEIKKKKCACDRMINRTMRGFSLQAFYILLICNQLECMPIIGDR